jgi:hypothetical protein
MQLPNTFDKASESVAPTEPAVSPAQSQLETEPRAITELVVSPDFPKSALGQFVEIGGNAGVVVEVVNQSLKIRAADGSIQSYNGNVLKKLYGPVQRHVPAPMPDRPRSSEASVEAGTSSPDSSNRGRADYDEDDEEEDADQPLPGALVAEANFEAPIRPITELVLEEDYPKNLLGMHIDIGGYTGVVIQLQNQSFRVRSRSGSAQSFNANVLRRVYGPAQKPKLVEASNRPTYKNPTPPPAPAAAPREIIMNPDYTAPVLQIVEYISRNDFPQCTLGKHIEITGFTGVVVEIVKQSLKVKSVEGTTRSYNTMALRRLYA